MAKKGITINNEQFEFFIKLLMEKLRNADECEINIKTKKRKKIKNKTNEDIKLI